MVSFRKIQLYPAVRVVLMLILGIIVGEATWKYISVYAWLGVLAIILIPDVIFRFRDRIESVLLMLSTFFIGVLLITLKERNNNISFPDGEVSYQAVVASQPVKYGKTVRCDLIVITAHKTFKLKASILRDTLTNRWSRLNVGDGIVARSVFRKTSNIVSTSNFDYVNWLKIHDFQGQTFIYFDSWKKAVVNITSLSHFERAKLQALKLRNSIVNFLGKLGLHDEELALVSAMTLGDKSMLQKNLKEEYSISGASHVLALSGLHLSIIYTIFSLFFPRRKWRAFTQCTILTAIWTYAVLVGLSPSVVRSALMISIYGLTSLIHRERVSLNALALAALIMLLINPWNLWDVGFQMSFMAVLGILMFYRMFYFPIVHRAPKFFKWVWGMVAVSLSAQLMVAPLVIFYFGRFSCYFILTNLIVIPAATVILYTTLIMFILTPFSIAQKSVAIIVARIAEWMNSGVSWVSALPGASIENVSVRVSQVLGIYLLIFCIYYFILFLQHKYVYKRNDIVFS